MTLCDFNNPARTCPTCGYVAKRLPTFRHCAPVPEPAWRPIPLGDVVERFLKRLGITKERVERWTRTAGKPGGCGCSGRQKWLNEWGNEKQRKIRSALLRARRFYVGS
jgi:hypothetical protein